MSLKTIL